MKCLAIAACLACAAVLRAEEEAAKPPLTPEQIREMLSQPDGEAAGLAVRILGDGGGDKLFYFPTRDIPATPAKWGFRFEDIAFESTDGTRLSGWFMPAKTKTAKGTVVFSHGNAGSIGHHLGFVMWLMEAGYQVFIYDYRGFGKSGGELDRRGMVEDVKSAFAYVRSRKDVNPAKLVSYGHSMGGAKSVTALSEKPVGGLRAIIIDGTFASYREMGRRAAGDLGAKIISDECSPNGCIAGIKDTPLLVVHGDKDEVVPIEQGRELFRLANEPKTLFEVKGGGHGNSLARDSGAYRKRMLEWLAGVM